jgi:hypothetical protein
MTKRAALSLFVSAVLAVAVAYAAAFLPGGPPVWAPWVFAGGTCLALVSLMAVGAARHGRIGRRLATAFGVVLVITAGGFGLLLALPPADPADPAFLLGLPVRAAVLLYGIGLLPFLVVPVAYAWTFDDMTLSETDLARVRAAALAAGVGAGADAPAGTGESPGPATPPSRETGAPVAPRAAGEGEW